MVSERPCVVGLVPHLKQNKTPTSSNGVLWYSDLLFKLLKISQGFKWEFTYIMHLEHG